MKINKIYTYSFDKKISYMSACVHMTLNVMNYALFILFRNYKLWKKYVYLVMCTPILENADKGIYLL